MKTEKEQYHEDLKSPYWWMYREAVLDIFGAHCNRCHSTNVLQIHHKQYHYGLKPWQYTNPDDIEVLCRRCHMKEHGIEEPSDSTFKSIQDYLGNLPL